MQRTTKSYQCHPWRWMLPVFVFLCCDKSLAINIDVAFADVTSDSKIVLVNLDDDDGNGQPDKDQTTGPYLAEDDLQEINVSVQVGDDYNGKVTISVEEPSSGGPRAKLWTDGIKTLPLPDSWDVTITNGVLQPVKDTKPVTFFVEGIKASATTDDVVIKATLSNGDVDEVKLTLLPVEVRGYATGERNSLSSEANEKYRHLIPDPADYTGFKTEPKTELKIVQWGDGDIFDANNNGAFDHAKFKEDVDIFRIRLPDIAPPAGTAEHRIKIWTVDAAGATLDQGAEVDLNVFDDFHETAALGLVADDETDDIFAVEGKADGALGDRTYRAKLGGKLKFQWLTCPGTGEKPIFEIPIRVKKIVTAKGFLLKGTTDAATATYWFERAKKIYSAIGVDLQYSLQTIDPLPAGVNLNDGFDIPEEITGYLHEMMPETIALMGDPGCQVTPGTIPVFFVKELNPAAQGVTNTPSYMAPGDEKYGGAIFIDSNHDQESVLAHELAHVLLDAQHDPSSNALWNDYFLSYDRHRTNIWFGKQSMLNIWSETGISAHRRLADTMRSRIWKSPYAKNP